MCKSCAFGPQIYCNMVMNKKVPGPIGTGYVKVHTPLLNPSGYGWAVFVYIQKRPLQKLSSYQTIDLYNKCLEVC